MNASERIGPLYLEDHAYSTAIGTSGANARAFQFTCTRDMKRVLFYADLMDIFDKTVIVP